MRCYMPDCTVSGFLNGKCNESKQVFKSMMKLVAYHGTLEAWLEIPYTFDRNPGVEKSNKI